MIRGTFGNIRLRNQLLDDVSGGYTPRLHPAGRSGRTSTTPRRTMRRNTFRWLCSAAKSTAGPVTDWAAKGTLLLGVRAVIAESFERIHRPT